jgi:hypothetical protein
MVRATNNAGLSRPLGDVFDNEDRFDMIRKNSAMIARK